MVTPEQKIIQVKKGVLPLTTLTSNQIEYLKLIQRGDFSIITLLQFCQKVGQSIIFRELWDLLFKLEKTNLLIEPRITDWQASNIEQKITELSQQYSIDQAKAKPSDLKVLPFFRNLQESVVHFLAELSTIHTVKSGTYLCYQGKKDRSLFVILEGQASIYRKLADESQRTLLARVEKGSIVGEIGFFLGEPRTADIIITQPGKVVKIDYSNRLDGVINSQAARQLTERFYFLQALMKMPMFKNLREFNFDRLLQCGNMIQLKENEVLFREGDEGDGFFIIIQGSILIMRNHQTINVLRPGDSFGEVALLMSRHERTATVTAQTPTLLMQIPYSQMIQLMFENLIFALLIENQAIERFQKDKRRVVSS